MVLTESGGAKVLAGEESQASLDGFVQSIAKWSKEGLLEHIVEFVVQEDQVSFIVILDDIADIF